MVINHATPKFLLKLSLNLIILNKSVPLQITEFFLSCDVSNVRLYFGEPLGTSHKITYFCDQKNIKPT